MNLVPAPFRLTPDGMLMALAVTPPIFWGFLAALVETNHRSAEVIDFKRERARRRLRAI